MPPQGHVPTDLVDTALFRSLPSSALEDVYAAGRRIDIDPEAFICRQGDPATAFYWLMEGHAKLTQVTEDGHQILARFLAPGDCCGIIAAHGGSEYQASVQAVEPCAVLGWSHDALTDLLRRHPQLALNALEVLAAQCQAWQRRYREATTARVEQRLALTLLRLARQSGERADNGVLINLPLSREDLAEMTSTTLFTVSRVMRRWEQRGIVELGRRRVVIRENHRLVNIAENGTAQLDGAAEPEDDTPIG